MAKYTPPGGNRNKNVKAQKSTATMKSVGSKEDQARVRRTVATAAIIATPTGAVARTVGRAVAKTAAKKLTPVTKVTRKTVTQSPRGSARVVNTAPKSVGGAKSSPVAGTKTTITKRKTVSPAQQAQGAANSARAKTRTGMTFAKGAVTGAYVEGERQRNKKGKK